MSSLSKTSFTVAAALTSAIVLVALTTPARAEDGKAIKCYGVAKSGENGCASQAANHSCAGHSTVDYSGFDWKLVPAGTCEKMGGKEKPFEGMGKMEKN
jgi:uncharacterized membrane protein